MNILKLVWEAGVIIGGTAIACITMSGISDKNNHDDYLMKDDGIMYKKFPDDEKNKKKK